MYIKTERLIIRDLAVQDTGAMLELQHDKQIMKFHPTFFNDATIEYIEGAISYFQGLGTQGLIYGEHGSLFAVCLKSSNETVGFITFNLHELINEWHMGWYFLSRYTGNGYASEASSVASDCFIETLSLEYISAGMRDDNPASFRVAQKSGFKLIEKRMGFDYNNADCNVNDFNSVSKYFDAIYNDVGSSGYYFQKTKKPSGGI